MNCQISRAEALNKRVGRQASMDKDPVEALLDNKGKQKKTSNPQTENFADGAGLIRAEGAKVVMTKKSNYKI